MIKDNKFIGSLQADSPNTGRSIIPKFIVLHYTAGWTAQSAIDTFTDSKSRVSAHVTIDQRGLVYQHVPFNIEAWHAGPSTHMGYSGLNKYSVGIEFVNPGYLVKTSDGYRDSFGRVHSAEKVGPVVASKHARVGSNTYYWPLYTEGQLDAGEELVEDLIRQYGIIDIVTHEQIDTRGWKTDPGPAFPLNRFRKLLDHRALDADRFQVTAATLNIRTGPGTNFPVKSALKKGDIVSVSAQNGDWRKISSDGWVHDGYLRRI